MHFSSIRFSGALVALTLTGAGCSGGTPPAAEPPPEPVATGPAASPAAAPTTTTAPTPPAQPGATTAPTTDPAVMRACQTASDCVPVRCRCKCSGCGGFAYDDVVNKAHENEWYERKGCPKQVACAEVCCVPSRLACEAGQCVVKAGERDDRKPPAPASQGVLRVTYLRNVVWGPCTKQLEVYVQTRQGYQVESQCQQPARPAVTRPSDEREFRAMVYAKTRLTKTYPTDPTYRAIGKAEVKVAPQGTTRCYRSTDGANTFCENAKGVITYAAYEGTKLKPPKRGANRSYLLVSYEER